MNMVMLQQIALTKYLHHTHLSAKSDNTIAENANPGLLQGNSTETDTGLAYLIHNHALITIGATAVTVLEDIAPNPTTDNLIEVLHKTITPVNINTDMTHLTTSPHQTETSQPTHKTVVEVDLDHELHTKQAAQKL